MANHVGNLMLFHLLSALRRWFIPISQMWRGRGHGLFAFMHASFISYDLDSGFIQLIFCLPARNAISLGHYSALHSSYMDSYCGLLGSRLHVDSIRRIIHTAAILGT